MGLRVQVPVRVLDEKIGLEMEKIYVLMTGGSDGKSSASLFETFEFAKHTAEKREDRQQKIEGNTVEYVSHYADNELITPPFLNIGRMLYCSFIQTKFRGETHGTWRAIYEQKIGN